jgi:hypothetical protein
VDAQHRPAQRLRAAGPSARGALSAVANRGAGASPAHDEGAFDCAVIDLTLHGQSALPIADRLLDDGKSFAIATGYGSTGVPDRFKDVPRLEKPFDPPALLRLVGQLSCSRSG